MVDLFRVLSTATHQYDLPFQYLGNLINTNFKYNSFTTTQTALGTANGYQHLWKEAEAKLNKQPFTQFTFLNDKTYYTISSLTDDSTRLFFTRLGANDPDFNLRREPAYIIRKKGSNQVFVNVIEPHGNYDGNVEVSTNSYSLVKGIDLIQDDNDYSVMSIMFDGKPLLLIQRNKDFNGKALNNITINNKKYSFNGNYTVLFDGNKLND